MNKCMVFFLVAVLILTITACESKKEADGNPFENLGKIEESQEENIEEESTVESEDETSEETESVEDSEAAMQLESYTEEELLGTWYAWDTNGNLLTLRIDYNETAAGNEPFFVLNSYNDIAPESRWGIWMETDYSTIPEEVDKTTIPSYQFMLYTINDADSMQVIDGITYTTSVIVIPYNDGTLHYKEMKFSIDPETGVPTPSEEIEWIFQKTLPWSGTYEETLDGIWLAQHEEEVAFFIMNSNGQFILQQEEAQVFGIYTLNGENLTITAHTAEGEAVSSDEAAKEVYFKDGVIQGDQEEEPFVLLEGGITGSYIAENGYHLEFHEDGTFYLSSGNNQTAGIYTADGENVTMYSLFGGGYTQSGFFASGTVTADSADLINSEENHMVFNAE